MDDFSSDNLLFGERIKDRRQELTLSLRELADLTDLSAAFLSALERGQANPTLASARRIANALGVPLHRLLADSTDNGLVVLKGRGMPVMLFGEETTIPAGALTLACRTGAIVLPVGVYHRPGEGHIFHIYPPLDVPSEGSVDDRVRLGSQRLAGVLEDMIRRAPEQWHVLQPVWPSDREAS